MILRVDKLAIELPMPANPSPNSASAAQELLGGKFGEFDSMGNPWDGTDVFSSGNLKLDLLHNFFLECGARANKIGVYEMVDDPVAREMVGYLLVRGGTQWRTRKRSRR